MAGVQKRKIQWAISLFLVMLYFSGLTAQAQYSGGTGEPNDPYLIYTAEQMNAIGANPNDWDKHFKLMADIDLAGYTGTAFNIIGTYASRPFTGVFDGNGHTISNFSYTSTDTDYIGIFVYVKGHIKDLGLIASDVDGGTGDCVGSLVGYLASGTISNCYAEGGSVSGDWRVGGLVGALNFGTIINSYATGSVSGNWDIGGLVGDNYKGSITTSYSTSMVSGGNGVGGLVGSNNYYSDITQCYSAGAVSGEDNIGGLVGRNSSFMTHCYSMGEVSGSQRVGGLVGFNDRGHVNACYSTGAVSGNERVGGLVGSGRSLRVSNSFWDIQTSGLTTGAGGTGQTTAGMQTASTFVDAGWDFMGEIENGTEDIWLILEGQDYPRLVHKLSAFSPNPQDGATSVNTTAILSWKPGNHAASHQIYFGTDKDAVRNANTASPEYKGTRDLGSERYDPGNLAWYTTYYWRVDEVNNVNADSPWIGRVWSFTTFDFIHFPYPPDGATNIISSPILSWVPPRPVLQYDIYFGQDEDAVANAIPASLGIYQGRQPPRKTTYETGDLEWGQTYYWRVDGVDEADSNSPWIGKVWSFTTANFLIVDDFESYSDLSAGIESNRIFNAWIDGYDDPKNGSLVGYDTPTFCEQTIVHSGNQSMPLYYDNSVGYSEATLTLTYPRDWTENGVNTLSIWFTGDSTNAAETLYVALNGNAVVYHSNSNAAQIEAWTEWNIDLQAFADQGVILDNVNSITLGLGNRTNPVAGGSGEVWFDDIRLYRPAEL